MRTITKRLLSILVVLSIGFTTAVASVVNYSAYVVYGENLQFPMAGIVANLYNSNGEYIASCITNEQGVFEFGDLIAGEAYSVHFITELEPFGVDLADAFLLLNYLRGSAELSDLQLLAADVNGDTLVDFADFAFLMNQWYLHGEAFPAGEWVFPVWTFSPNAFKTEGGPDGPITIVSQSDISSDLDPVIKDSRIQENVLKEFTYDPKSFELTIPVSSTASHTIFGLGLEMAFDHSNFEIVGLESGFEDINTSITNQGIKLSWVSEKGKNLEANTGFLSLKVRMNNVSDQESVLQMLSEAQFVGADGRLLSDVQLNMPKLKKSIAAIEVGNPYPNPGNDQISLALNQITSDQVFVEIYNLSGQLIKTLTASPKNSNLIISTAELPTGTYLCSIKFDTNQEVKLFNVQH